MGITRKFMCLIFVLIVCFTPFGTAQLSRAVTQSEQNLPGCWPREYSVKQDDISGILTLSTAYYTIQHNLKSGGAITKIKYTHGNVANLLVEPIKTSVQNDSGIIFNDADSPSANVSCTKTGKTEIVTIQCSLVNKSGQDSGIR